MERAWGGRFADAAITVIVWRKLHLPWSWFGIIMGIAVFLNLIQAL